MNVLPLRHVLVEESQLNDCACMPPPKLVIISAISCTLS
jgi:hypothetical protein